MVVASDITEILSVFVRASYCEILSISEANDRRRARTSLQLFTRP